MSSESAEPAHPDDGHLLSCTLNFDHTWTCGPGCPSTQTDENAATVPDVIAAHQRTNELGNPCVCGRWPTATRGLGWHEHLTAELAPLFGDILARARAGVLREHADREVERGGHGQSLVERLHEHAHEHDGYLTKWEDDRG